jgi:NAD(P)-dependent dehydrogenase (short-subunit alcohol dehydrogenase family)
MSTPSPFRADLMAGKHVLVTGGGTGLGMAVARRMAEHGARVVICGRRKDVLDETAAAIARDTGQRVRGIPCDIRDPAQVEAMLDAIWAEAPLDILVNNAAANFLARTETLSARAFDAIVGISLNGNAYCTLGAGRRWIAAGAPGAILNVLAAGVGNGRAYTVPLTMSKAALLAMTRSLAVEWGPKGIRVNAIAPGLFPTPGAWQQLFPEGRSSASDPTASIPLKRFGEHAEFADMCVFLVSDAATYLNGDMVTLDGGRALKGMDIDDLAGWSDEQWESLKKKRSR